MPLNSSDRKNLSKKFVTIPDENASFSQNITNLDLLIVDLQNLDVTYKGLFDEQNNLVPAYHTELSYLNGQTRTNITEQDIQDSAKKVRGNFFFPNNTDVPTPFLTDGVWKELKSYAKNIAVGKTYAEVISTQESETDKITDVTDLTASIFADYSEDERQTGVEDVPPDPPFNLADDLAALIAAVNVWENYLNQQKTALQANIDTDNASDIQDAIDDIDAALDEITAWEALDDYAIGGKVDDPGLDILNNAATARLSFIPTRTSQVTTRLGDITQNANGSIASFSGLYGARYINIDSRINLAEGTLTKTTGLELAKRVQQENINNNNNYLQYLTDEILVASKLSVNANGTTIITVADASLFTVSDSVYVVSDTVAELAAEIVDIDGNVITLDTVIPNTYTVGGVARLLKEV